MSDKINTTTQNLTPNDVNNLSKDPKNVMYEYQFDTVDRVKAVNEVEYLFRECKNACDKIRKEHPEFCDNRCRKELMKDPTFADFSTTHPFFFKFATDRNVSARDMRMAYFQLNLKADVEAGRLSQDEATNRMKMFVIEECKNPHAPLPNQQ